MAMSITTNMRNARLDVIAAAIDADVGAGRLRIYAGARPASGGTATTLLAELTLTDPCAPAAASGVLTFSTITANNAVATGIATWARIVTSTGTFCIDMDVGTSGSDLNLNNTSITSGQNVAVTSATITDPNS